MSFNFDYNNKETKEMFEDKFFEYDNRLYFSNAIDSFYRDMDISKPKKPSKPVFNGNTAEDARNFAIAFQQYENANKTYAEDYSKYEAYRDDLRTFIFEKIWKGSSIEQVPENYRLKVWNYAWESAHSDGFGAVYNKLESIIDYIF